MPAARPALLWDIFCQVIDNHGDLGVCWRLARQLAAHGQRVRLWVDDARALPWMAPGALEGAFARIRVLPWTRPIAPRLLAALPPAQVWVEAFGCEIAPEFIAHYAQSACPEGHLNVQTKGWPVWLNLEYLSAEDYVARMHGLPSPVLHGPAAGATKWFFYPGFSAATGGLLREAGLPARQAAFDRAAWLAAHGVRPPGPGESLASLFCYEPQALPALLAQWQGAAAPWHLLVTPGRATLAVQQALRQLGHPGIQGHDAAPGTPIRRGALSISYLPHLPQTAYDALLWACDLNFVRGEDSLVRALWAGRPLVWQIYPQHDQAHHAKLAAFLDTLAAPAPLRALHAAWNALPQAAPLQAPTPAALPAWRHWAEGARAALAAQPDLAAQLIAFATEKAPLKNHLPATP